MGGDRSRVCTWLWYYLEPVSPRAGGTSWHSCKGEELGPRELMGQKTATLWRSLSHPLFASRDWFFTQHSRFLHSPKWISSFKAADNSNATSMRLLTLQYWPLGPYKSEEIYFLIWSSGFGFNFRVWFLSSYPRWLSVISEVERSQLHWLRKIFQVKSHRQGSNILRSMTGNHSLSISNQGDVSEHVCWMCSSRVAVFFQIELHLPEGGSLTPRK